MPRHLIPCECTARPTYPLPACPLPHSSQTAFVCFCRDVPGVALNQTVATDWQPPDAQSALFKWTSWTLAMALPWWKHHKHCLWYYYHYYYNLNVFFFSFHLVVACGKLDKSCSTCIRVIVALDQWQVEMITTLRDSVKIIVPSWNSLVSLKISMCPTCMYLRLTTFVENKTTMLSSRLSVTMRLCSGRLTIENFHHGKSLLFTRCCSCLLLLPAGLWHF